MTRDDIDRFSSILLVVIAVGMAAVFLYDRQQADAPPPAVLIQDWEELNRSGVLIGSEDAQLVITEFLDFTCPFCRDLVPVTDSLLAKYPQKVAVVVQHFPLPNREMSSPAAIASECAAEQGRFKAMHDALFSHIDSIGEWGWSEFAVEAGVPDALAFQRCIERPIEQFPRIVRGLEIGAVAAAIATPTVWMNGQVVDARTVREFEALADELGVDLRSNGN